MSNEVGFSIAETLIYVWQSFDSVIQFLPANGRLLFWGIAAGIVTMLVYRKLSAQNVLSDLKEQINDLKKEMKSVDSSSKEYRTIVGQSLKLSMKRLKVSLTPALLASLPILLVLPFLDYEYGYSKPSPGTPVALLSDQAQELNVDKGRLFEKGWVFNWPGNEEAITVNDNSGNELMVITKDSHSGVASKSNLTQFLFGAPAGRLPQDAIVEQLTIAPLAQDLLIKNITMPYQWTGTFFFALIMSSLAMKFGLKIQ